MRDCKFGQQQDYLVEILVRIQARKQVKKTVDILVEKILSFII